MRGLGNVLHRIRVPLRVAQAEALHAKGVPIEAYDQLDRAQEWIGEYAVRNSCHEAKASPNTSIPHDIGFAGQG